MTADSHVLVTGGAGFIGSHLVDSLLERPSTRVTVLDRLSTGGSRANLEQHDADPRLRLVLGDVCDAPMVHELMAGVDAVIHAAAESHVDRSIDDAIAFLRTNVLGTQVVLDACRDRDVRMLMLSTDEVYGPGERGGGAFDERDPLRPASPYAASKAAADLLCSAHVTTYGTRVTTVRGTNAFGPRQIERVMPTFAICALEGRSVPVYSEGRERREFLYVSDWVDAALTVLDAGEPGAIYNIGGGLGRAFLAQLPPHHDLHAFDHAALDIGDHHAVMRTIPLLRADAILNLAAFTDVDGCEIDPERAVRDNALGPQNLALAARACGAVLLHVSTDYVFDGTKGAPYDELDVPDPLSVYGSAKLAGERFVRDLAPQHLVVRTGYVFGAGNDYASRAAERLRGGEIAGGIKDRIGSPTFVRHLAARLLPLLLTARFGTYHVAGPEATSWYDVLQRARTIGGFPGTLVVQDPAMLGLLARRPANSALTSAYLPHLGIDPLPPLDAAIAEWVAATG